MSKIKANFIHKKYPMILSNSVKMFNIHFKYLVILILLNYSSTLLLSQGTYLQVVWGTYFSSDDPDIGDFFSNAKLDSQGNITVAGGMGLGAPITAGVHQTVYGGEKDAIIAKFDSDGKLLMSTYLGGPGLDFVRSHANDPSDNIVILGRTTSLTNIASTGANKETFSGLNDAFIAKFRTDGTLLWSTYFGGTEDEQPYGLTIDKQSNIYIVGLTTSTSQISSDNNVHQPLYGGGLFDSFITKYDPNGKLLWSTYFGGTGADYALGLDIDQTGDLMVVGTTYSTTKISTPDALERYYKGNGDGFIAKFSPGGKLIYATYFGGSSTDELFRCHVDKENNLYATGYTLSNNISTDGTIRQNKEDGLLVKFNSSGVKLWATYIGGNDYDHGLGIDTDKNDNPVLVGLTKSSNLLVTENTIQDIFNGNYDGFFVKYSSNGELLWSTYFGGAGDDRAGSIAIDEEGQIYGTVNVQSSGLATPGAFQTISKGFAGFLVKIKEVETVSTVEPKDINPFIIYPNPVCDNINLPIYDSLFNVHIYRNDGSIIQSNLNFRNTTLKVSTLPEGNYFLVLENQGSRRVAQFVKM